GYYDRLLPQLSCAHKVGLCFPFQLLGTLPAEEHDIPMNEVITC
ncbi:MAG: 5-formyltetrahydrofolate cyclo-ligase, partial [Bacteroidaceae bacterium]|nr:5-formyltetrahydrofolate cyclo-ligase [Bacteroidaceae bacterium]